MKDPNLNARISLRIPAALMLAGQIGYVAVTQVHASGPANDHHTIFHTYAADRIWEAVHLGQFVGMALLLGGLIAFAVVLEGSAGASRWLARFGAAASVATLSLYGVLQAVDGVALKQAVTAWANAPEAEQAARFAAAETVRWLEWGMRSYQDFALGLALLLVGAAALPVRRLRTVAILMALSASAYFAQGWISGTDGFSSGQSIAIVAAWALSLFWMIGLFIAGTRDGRSDPSRQDEAGSMRSVPATP